MILKQMQVEAVGCGREVVGCGRVTLSNIKRESKRNTQGDKGRCGAPNFLKQRT